jgi:phenylpyruvate tautomerase PptA (4-oxalocrotonate tautomerase family)
VLVQKVALQKWFVTTKSMSKVFIILRFGDKDPITSFISDLTVTNNGDSQKVLATVAATLYAFTDENPEAIVIATGSTEARIRLLRRTVLPNGH